MFNIVSRFDRMRMRTPTPRLSPHAGRNRQNIQHRTAGRGVAGGFGLWYKIELSTPTYIRVCLRKCQHQQYQQQQHIYSSSSSSTGYQLQQQQARYVGSDMFRILVPFKQNMHKWKIAKRCLLFARWMFRCWQAPVVYRHDPAARGMLRFEVFPRWSRV